jgi:hypothetical protein
MSKTIALQALPKRLGQELEFFRPELVRIARLKWS